jgi:hypothetical protein
MAARTGLTNLISELRGMCNAGTADYIVAGAAYWTDDQLQTTLDRHRREVIEEPLYSIGENEGGTSITKRYYSHCGNYEQTTGGTAVFVVKDSSWNAVGTALYSADYQRGEILFTQNTAGSVYCLTGRSYDLNAAAADVWERKASQVTSAAYSWSTDNMRVDKSKLRGEAVEMARYYRGLAGPQVLELDRSDT